MLHTANEMCNGIQDAAEKDNSKNFMILNKVGTLHLSKCSK